MADFVYGSLWVYVRTGFSLASDTSGGTIIDIDGDDTLEGNEAGPTTPGSFPVSTQYYGTITIGGIAYPVFQGTDSFQDLMLVSRGTTSPASSFNPASINVGNSFLFCFGEGTAIATPGGTQTVERLSVGDLVLTADGRQVPVRWVGRQTVFPAFNPPLRRKLIRIRQGALGGGLPRRDLTLTADHALLIDGMLVQAGALVNGTSVAYMPEAEVGASYTVYHIETEGHEVILAEGQPAETYIDYIARRAFDNYAEYVALYGEDQRITEMPYPRICAPDQLPQALRARFKANRPTEPSATRFATAQI